MPIRDEALKVTYESMKTIVDFGDDSVWKEIATTPQARMASVLSQTAVSTFFEAEGRAEDGAHPRRWFTLVAGGRADVVLCVLPPGVEAKSLGQGSDCHVAGFQNRNPYPKFSDRIDSLSEAIGIEIAPNFQGARLDTSDIPNSTPGGLRP